MHLLDGDEMKTGEDFRKACIQYGIHFWNIHHCSFCYYECSFVFNYEDNEIVYDSGCFCTKSKTLRFSTWDDVAKQYNCNLNNKETIKRYNEFWKFNNEI